jgi:hypothetical protein
VRLRRFENMHKNRYINLISHFFVIKLTKKCLDQIKSNETGNKERNNKVKITGNPGNRGDA